MRVARAADIHVCQSCGAVYGKWQGRCDACGEWNTIAAEAASWLKPGAPPPVVIGHCAEPTSEIYSFRGPGPHLLYTGRFSLSHPERTIGRLLGSFERIRARSPGAHLHLVGMLTEAEKSELAAHAVSAFVTLHGEVPHRTALAMQSASDALILYQQSTAALPGKLSEYLLATAPILVLGDGEWRSRLIGTPHFPVEEAEYALNSPRRQPTDVTAAAINAYEAVLLGAVGEPRTERQS